MTTISRFSNYVNDKFNQTIGTVATNTSKLTDISLPLLNTLRSIDGSLKGVEEIPVLLRRVSEIFSVRVPTIDLDFTGVLKPYVIVIEQGKNFLTFLEIFGKIKEWKKINLTTDSWAKIGKTGFGLGQKALETFFLIPGKKWNWYNLGNFCASIGSRTGIAITPLYFSLSKEVCMVSASVCSIVAAKQDIAKESTRLQGPYGLYDKFLNLSDSERCGEYLARNRKTETLSRLNDEIKTLRNSQDQTSDEKSIKLTRLENKFIARALLIPNCNPHDIEGLDKIVVDKWLSAKSRFPNSEDNLEEHKALINTIARAKFQRVKEKIEICQNIIKEKKIAIRFDAAKGVFGGFTIVAQLALASTFGPAANLIVDLGFWTTGWFVSYFGTHRTYFSGWEKINGVNGQRPEAKYYLNFA